PSTLKIAHSVLQECRKCPPSLDSTVKGGRTLRMADERLLYWPDTPVAAGLLSLPKPSPPQPQLHGIQPRIRRGQPRIRYMQVPHLDAPIIFLAKNVRPQGRAGREVHRVCISRNVVITEQHSAAQFQIWREAPAT